MTDFGYDEAIRAFADFPGDRDGAPVPGRGLADLRRPGRPRSTSRWAARTATSPSTPTTSSSASASTRRRSTRVHHGRMQLSTRPRCSTAGRRTSSGARRRCAGRTPGWRAPGWARPAPQPASALARVADREARVHAARRSAAGRRGAGRGAGGRAGADGDADRPTAARPRRLSCRAPDPVVRRAQGVAATRAGEDPNSWERRRRRAAEYLIPWIEQTVPLAGKTVLEYGCGNAAVSCAFAERAERVIGVDIDAAGSSWPDRRLREQRRRQRRARAASAGRDPRRRRRADAARSTCSCCMRCSSTSRRPERLAVLRLRARRRQPDGAIVVCETPNRLIYFDHHTAQMPFFHLLPDELALSYYPRSARADFKAAIDAAAAARARGGARGDRALGPRRQLPRVRARVRGLSTGT